MVFQGTYAPIVTPFLADESINYPVLEQLIEYLIGKGISGLVIGGTTGEVYALSSSERLKLFAFAKKVTGQRIPLVAGVNAGATREVISFAKEAENLGYQALMAAVPPYSRPDQNELTAHFRQLATAVDLPILLYNFPWRAGSEIGVEVLDGLAELDNIVGIKEASGEMSRLYDLRVRFGERYQLVCGADDQALDYLLWGASSWIGGAACFLPAAHEQVIKLAAANDLAGAKALFEKLLPLFRNLEEGHYTQKVKFGCQLLGFEVGPPRRPLLPLPPEAAARFETLCRQALEVEP